MVHNNIKVESSISACNAVTASASEATQGRKYDSDKPRWSLVPCGVIPEVLGVLEYGAKKYDVNNWQHVPQARTRYYDALMRHVEAWWQGEKHDPETGSLHLAHAACCVLFLLWFDLGK